MAEKIKYQQTLLSGIDGRKIWKIYVKDENGIGIIIKEWGVKDGKIQRIEKRIEKGKNIGKKNETSPLEQAINEAKSTVKKRMRENISTEHGELKSEKMNFRPMLLKKWVEHEHKFEPPFFVQPKYDGERVIAFLNKKEEKRKKEKKSKQYTLMLISRKGKLITILPSLIRKEIKKTIIKISKEINLKKIEDIYLDGELLSFDYKFERFTGLFRKIKGLSAEQQKILETVNFVPFDLFIKSQPELDFTKRWKIIDKFLPIELKRVIKPPIEIIKKKKNIILKRYLDKGYEGAVIRIPSGIYKPNKRVDTVLKLKEDNEEDGTIIGFKEGMGKEKGMPVWEVKMENDKTTWARPKGTVAERKNYFKNAKKYIGKYVTIIFQEETIYGKKRFPRAEFRFHDDFS